jgi:hypothetical protein
MMCWSYANPNWHGSDAHLPPLFGPDALARPGQGSSKHANCWLRCTGGSLRGSTHLISERRSHYLTFWRRDWGNDAAPKRVHTKLGKGERYLIAKRGKVVTI